MAVCICVPGAWPRATCVSAAIRRGVWVLLDSACARVKEAVYGRPSFGDFIDGPRHRRTTRDQRAPASAQTEKEKGNGEEKKGREKADTAIHDYVA